MMNIKIVGIITIVLIAMILSRCSHTSKEPGSQSIVASKLDVSHLGKREVEFTDWLPNRTYQKRFKNKSRYYREHKTYPAYIEMDTEGNRRVLEIPYEPSFHWRASSGRLKEEFQKIHIRETLNRGKKLLSLHIMNKDGVDIYTGVWVSAKVFEREAKKLSHFGIEPPLFPE